MLKVTKYTLVSMLFGMLLWGEYRIDYSSADFSFYKENNFDRIKALKFSLRGDPGTPELPAVYLKYIIPPDMKAESLIIAQCSITQIPGNYLIYPAQPSHLIGDTVSWVGPSQQIYNSDTLFPGKVIRIVDEGVLDGARIITLEVKPLQYRPKTKRLYLLGSIKFKIAYNPDVKPLLKAQRRSLFEQGVYDAALLDIVTNDNEIPSFYSSPNLVEEGQLASMGPFPAAPAVIITPSDFASAFQPYANWLIDQGISTAIISPSLIYDNFSGVDDAEKVRNYIKYVYEHNGGTYFILGGDDGYVPIRCAWDPIYPWAYDTIVPTDMYFLDLTGNWDVNGNHRWGEVYSDSADRFPEVFVGRITVNNSQEVSNWVGKALSFEKTPGVLFDTVLWVYSTEVDTGATPDLFPPHITQVFAEDYNASAVLDMFNKGYGLVNTNCHGNIQTFRTRHNPNSDIKSFWSSSPSPDYAGLNYLNNPNKYSLVYSICCLTACYEGILSTNDPASDTCIMDAYMDAYRSMVGTPLGSCAYLGNTRAGVFYNSFDLQYAFWDRIMNPWWTGYGPPEPSITRIGVAEALSKCDEKIDWHPDSTYERHVCYSHNLFGSPYTESWTKSPRNMSVSHPSTIYAGQQVQFTVTVRTTTIPQTPLQYAKVCLNKSGDVYLVGSTNANGQVTFTFTPQSVGSLKVTVTRLHNADNNYNQYRPSQTTCQVIIGRGGESSDSKEILPTALRICNLSAVLRGNALIKLEIPEKGEMTLSIFDVSGAKVQLVTREDITPGFYQRTMNTDALANGVYFVTLGINNKKISQKFLLVN